MTQLPPKEKADELIDKFAPIVAGADRYGYNLKSMNIFIAKQCAIIEVDEMLKDLIELHDKFDIGISYKIDYYNEVKTELEKL